MSAVNRWTKASSTKPKRADKWAAMTMPPEPVAVHSYFSLVDPMDRERAHFGDDDE